MKVIVAGSRSIEEFSIVDEILNSIKKTVNISKVISGTARGVDKLGEKWAKENHIQIEHYPADWNKYGKSAGYRRNAEMAVMGDLLVCIWDGESRGSQHMYDCMVQLKKPTYLYNLKTGIKKKKFA